MSDDRYRDLLSAGWMSIADARFMLGYELSRDMRTPEVNMIRASSRGVDFPNSDDGVETLMSTFKDARSRDPMSPVGLATLSDAIRASDSLRQRVEGLRALDETAYRKAKRGMPAVTPGGVFARRRKDALLRHSGLVVVDIDHRDDAFDIRKSLEGQPEVALGFVSPSGEGVKVFVGVDPVPSDAREHEAACVFTAACVQRATGIPVDAVGKDVSRLCFLSYDPEAVVNLESSRLSWDVADVGAVRGRDYSHVRMGDLDVSSALNSIPADSHAVWWRVGRALHNAFGESGFAYFDTWSATSSKYKEGAVRSQWSAYGSDSDDRIGLGTVFHLARQHGWVES